MSGSVLSCPVCGQPARRKCTRCGQAFCDLHIRYGNPHFTVGSLIGGTGYYCDDCWADYAKQGNAVRLVVGIAAAIMLLVMIIVAVLMMITAFGITGIGWWLLRLMR